MSSLPDDEGAATSRPSPLRRAASVIRAVNPQELADEGTLLMRWRLGTRRVLTRPAVWFIAGGTLALVYGVLQGAAGQVVAMVCGVVGGVAAYYATAWFSPPAIVVAQDLRSLPLGSLIVIGGDSLISVEASPIVAAVHADFGLGPDYYVGLKNGTAIRHSTSSEVSVVTFRDPWEPYRILPETTLPTAARHLGDVLSAVDRFEGHLPGKLVYGAHEQSVVDHLVSAFEVGDVEARNMIKLTQELGLLQRDPKRKLLRFTDAGRVWEGAATLQLEPESTPEPLGADEERKLAALVRETAGRPSHLPEPFDVESFQRRVLHVVMEFKRLVETTRVIDTLWFGDKPHSEAGVQGLAEVLFRLHCELRNVDLSKEPNAGNGPVDFKFAQGWDARALIEFKLLSNTRSLHGVRAQLPAYLASEDIACGFFVCIGFTDSDLAESRVNRIRVEAEKTSARLGYRIAAVFVDARRRPSASTLR